MTFHYVRVEEAIASDGLRMVVVGEVPSPWGEAAKGIFHVKQLEWVAVRLAQDDDTLITWTGGHRSAPVAIYRNERPRSGWAEILLLAERLAPTPSWLPTDAAERTLVFGLAHEIFTWPQNTATAPRRDVTPLPWSGRCSACWRDASRPSMRPGAGTMSAAPCRRPTSIAQRPWRISDRCRPSNAQCAKASGQPSKMRDAMTDAALDPILLEHRDWIYAKHLGLPLSL
jgi:hypothetical protein